MSRRGWILTALGILAALVVGVVVATMVFPADQPKPVAKATATTMRIDPAPAAAPSVVPVVRAPVVDTPAYRAPAVRKPPPSHPRVVPDPDPASVTTTNSW